MCLRHSPNLCPRVPPCDIRMTRFLRCGLKDRSLFRTSRLNLHAWVCIWESKCQGRGTFRHSFDVFVQPSPWYPAYAHFLRNFYPFLNSEPRLERNTSSAVLLRLRAEAKRLRGICRLLLARAWNTRLWKYSPLAHWLDGLKLFSMAELRQLALQTPSYSPFCSICVLS